MKKLLGIVLSVVLILSSMSALMVSAVAPIAPALPEKTVAVLDMDGVSKTLGDNGDWRLNWWEGRFAKAVTAVDFTKADYVEFDIKYSNYETLKSFVETNGISFTFNVTSTAGPWDYRSNVNFMNYGTDIGNGWYHYQIPKTAFAVKSHSGVDWSTVNFWYLFGEGADVAFGDICSETLTITNICGTAAEKPEVPANSILIDEYGATTTVGAQYVWLWDRLLKTTATADLSDADFIEFDMKSDMYEELKTAGTANYLTFVLVSNYASTQNKWINRHYQLEVFKYETDVNGDWHHFRIPKSTFAEESGADWSNVDFWMFGFWNNAGETGELGSATIEVKNICGTVLTAPALPEKAVAVLDSEGMSNTLGDNADWTANWYYDRFVKVGLTAADFTNADYIEFDIHYSNYAKFASYVKDNGMDFGLHITSSASKWGNRSAASNILRYGEDIGNGWYHYTIPKVLFTLKQGEGVDWSMADSWFLFGEGSTATFGSIFADTLTIANICGTAEQVPAAPENSTMLDADGGMASFRENFSYLYGALYKTEGLTATDFSSANYIEFDIKFSNYDDFMAVLAAKPDMRLDFRLGSSAQLWLDVLGANGITNYFTAGENGWYHVILPKTAFVGAGIVADNFNWNSINCWYFTIENGNMSTTVDGVNMASDLVSVRNICGTVEASQVAEISDAPAVPVNATAILDENGAATTIGDELGWLWDRLCVPATATDFTDADYIEFDMKSDMYDALKSAGETYCLTISLASDFATTANKWAQRHSVLYVFNYETGTNGDWHHFRIPKEAFNVVDEGADWSNKDFWMLGFWSGGGVAAGDVASATIDVKNICGTTYVLKNDSYTVSDGYAVIGQGTDVSEITTVANKVYTADGNIVISGDAVTGMTIKLEANGWVYDKATVVVDNDVTGDGVVNALDITHFRKIMFETETATEIQNVAITGSKTAAPTIIDYIQMKNAFVG